MSYIGKHISSLATPAFIVDKEKVEKNCRRMLDLAKSNGIHLRGQTKTHKTVEGGIAQTGGTKRKVVTSTLIECEMYADQGFDDILYGFPFIQSHLERVFALTERLEEFHLMVANQEACQMLEQSAPPEGKLWSVFLKVDCGNARAGVWWEDDEAVDIVKFIQGCQNLTFQGIYAHCGNSYGAHSISEVERVRDNSVEMMVSLAGKLKEAGLECPHWGVGSTPSCSHASNRFENLTEIHPGNYVFYDNQQVGLGSCGLDDVAGKVLTRVLGHYPKRKQMLVDCGFTAITKQGIGSQAHPKMIAPVDEHQDLMLSNMTQEIGFVEPIAPEGSIDFSLHPVGSLLKLIPYHSCASAACHPTYYVHDSQGIIQELWTPCRGW